jgi:hypothetical protein
MISRASRAVGLVAALSASALLAGCEDNATSPGSQSGAAAPLATTTAVTETRPLPSAPPPGACGAGNVVSQADYQHPKLGAMRIFTLIKPRGFDSSWGCVVAVTATGKAVVAVEGVDIHQDALTVADPVSDATSNAFVTYNPGRYDGVLVLTPTDTGFEPISPKLTGVADHPDPGQRNFYYAELLGPGSDGQYQLKTSMNDCDPSCGEGTTTSKTLLWNGSDYEVKPAPPGSASRATRRST